MGYKNPAPCLAYSKLYDDSLYIHIYIYISDEEAKRAKRKIHEVKNDTGVSHKKKPQQSGENIYVRHGNECFGSSGSLLSHNATVLSIDADNKYCGSPAGCQHILFTQAS